MDKNVERVLRLFPDDCQPHAVEPIRHTGGFSGAELWRLQAPRGPLCLRRWPAGHPSHERLEFIQAVLWHVDQEGFHRIPVPLETRHHHGYVLHAGHLWELAPWLPGAADYRQSPNPARLRAALRELASFHQATASFPLPEIGPETSPGVVERRERLRGLVAGRFDAIRAAMASDTWPDLVGPGRQILALAINTAPKVMALLDAAADIHVTLQPCIRDVWSAHILFRGDEVTGIVDFGSMRAENVAADVARLLGSMTGDHAADWQQGLAAYQEVRRLSNDEMRLLVAFDRSTVLMGGIQWLEWIFLEGRVFADRAGVLSRVTEFLTRLTVLAQG